VTSIASSDHSIGSQFQLFTTLSLKNNDLAEQLLNVYTV